MNEFQSTAFVHMAILQVECVQVNCKVTHPTGGAATSITLAEGDYFGELALQGQFKSASTLVSGKTGALAMSISQEEFSKCCGPLTELYQQVRYGRPSLRPVCIQSEQGWRFGNRRPCEWCRSNGGNTKTSSRRQSP